VVDRVTGREVEHQVGEHSAGDAADDLRRGIDRHLAKRKATGVPAEQCVGEGHHRVEVRARHRAEDEDQGE